MTREDAIQNKDVIVAFAKGEMIQERKLGTTDWIDTENPCFDSAFAEFRIKPKQKYRPFETLEECLGEMHKHNDFGWVMAKDKNELIQIGRILMSRLDNVMITLSIDEGHNFNSSYYFKNYTFADGTPFGVKEE